MAGVLQRFERRLEGAVMNAFTRAFRSAVQPVEIAAALQREVDNNAHVVSRDRVLVPNQFDVELSTSDYDRLAPFGETLITELTTLLAEHIADQRYTASGPLSITLSEDEALRTGRFEVTSHTNAAVAPVSTPSDTAIRRAVVSLEVFGVRHPLTLPVTVIGRGSIADLRIDDPGVSRSHARINVDQATSPPTVTVTDLDSTNGIILDGRRVDTGQARHGSHIRLGSTTLVVSIASEDEST